MHSDKDLLDILHRARPGKARYKSGEFTYQATTPALDEASREPVVICEVEETGETLLVPLRKWGGRLGRPDEFQTEHYSRRPRQGSRWRHYKGGEYAVVANAFHVDSGEHYVVYRANALVWARPAASWFGTVETTRFTPVA